MALLRMRNGDAVSRKEGDRGHSPGPRGLFYARGQQTLAKGEGGAARESGTPSPVCPCMKQDGLGLG
jgi:hypothetical protein